MKLLKFYKLRRKMEVSSVVNWILFNKALAIKMLIRYFSLIFPRYHFPVPFFFYTLIVFHFPFLNKIKAIIVINVSAAGIEINTPFGPIPKYLERK